MLLDALAVCLGGGIGAVARWGVGRAVQHGAGSGFPWSTLAVNVVGSLLLGALAGWIAEREVTERTRLFLSAGVLGGFTTYSSFNQETLELLEARGPGLAGGYVVTMVAVCLAAGWLGGGLVRHVVH
jgi:CrcB protein